MPQAYAHRIATAAVCPKVRIVWSCCHSGQDERVHSSAILEMTEILFFERIIEQRNILHKINEVGVNPPT